MALAVVAAMVLTVATSVAPGAVQRAAAAGYAAELRRYPYLTDLVGGNVTVNFATDTSQSSASLVIGPAPGCTGRTVGATSTQITVGSVPEYQWKARVSGLSTDAQYCYRVYLGGVDLLGTDASPVFTSQLAAGSTASFSFAVFGDWGQTSSSGNQAQANILSLIAQSPARFAVSVGDTGYQAGSQTTYGDLVQPGSAVFGPSFWTVPGRSLALFNAPGNHGFDSTYLLNWPQDAAAASSGGRYQMESYTVSGVTSNRPSAWFAFDAGNSRFYVLTATWAGTSSNYQNDYNAHWTQTSAEYQWLQQDLAAHPNQLKFAFWHYPLYADNSTETSDAFLQGPNSLEGLLAAYGVNIGFTGHTHIYQRNAQPPGGILTYVTGGGGATPEPVTGCTAIDKYAIGWSASKCGSAPLPTSASQVYHYLLVTVTGTSVRVQPRNSDGGSFDGQTYDFGTPPPPPPDTTPPSPPSGLTATAAGKSQIDLSWTASTDNVGVTGYRVSRDGTVVATLGNTTSWSDTGLSAGTTHTYTLRAFDAAGNSSSSSAPASATTRAAVIVTREAGSDRFGTAAQVSAATFPIGVPVAYVATGFNYPDALAAGPAAARLGGPVLLVKPNAIPGSTGSELKRLRPQRIVVVGGAGVVSDGVVAQLRPYATTGSVTRQAGIDRFATAAQVSALTFPNGVPAVYVATGFNYPDALAAGPAAAKLGGAVLLVKPDAIPSATASELNRLKAKRAMRIIVVGGAGAVSDGVLAQLRAYSADVSRQSGQDRFATAARISTLTFPGGVPALYVATGLDYPDALAAGPAAAVGHGPVLLVTQGSIPSPTDLELKRLVGQQVPRVYVAGGSGAVSDAVVGQLRGY